MQGKNFIAFKLAVFTGALLTICTQFLIANVQSVQQNKDKNKDTSKEIIIFDYCSKDNNKKCEREKKAPVTDYSKSLK